MNWIQHPTVPNVSYASGLMGGYYVRLHRADGSHQTVETHNELERETLVAEWSRSPEHIPLGDLIAAVTAKLGIKKCLPCARRQQALNRWLKKRG